MKARMVYEILPSSMNGRNSEGCFFAGTDGEILFGGKGGAGKLAPFEVRVIKAR